MSSSKDLTGYYNVHAWMLSQKGLKEESLTYWARSSEMNGSFSDYANVVLAREAAQKGDYPRTMAYANKISDQSFAASAKYEILGDYWIRQDQPLEAIAAYDRALSINSGKLPARKKLVAVLSNTGSPRAAQEQERLLEMASFYPAQSRH